jgi:hypothetical protein
MNMPTISSPYRYQCIVADSRGTRCHFFPAPLSGKKHAQNFPVFGITAVIKKFERFIDPGSNLLML